MLGIHDVDLNVNLLRIVGADLRPVAIFQRCDDPPTVRIVLRIRTRNNADVKRQAHPKTANLHIPFLHDVEKPHLQFFRQVGKLVDAEDPPVCTWNQPIVNDQFIR